MRCLVSNPRTLRRLERRTGLAIDHALVRGGTGHRYDLYLKSGVWVSLFRDGTVLTPAEQGLGPLWRTTWDSPWLMDGGGI
jgi:hypothetical protein